jgi:4'-phosphopantetheinyl transferase
MDVWWHAVGMDEVPLGDGWLSPAEAARIAGMHYPKRRTEFRLGRWTAKHALAQLLAVPQDEAGLARIEIRSDPDGAPNPHRNGKPLPVSMSMSDRADWAVCVASTHILALGCDVELVEPRSDLFLADYLTTAEQHDVASAGGDRDVLANLFWSAKESALKVLRTGLRRDTRSVEVTLAGHREGDDPQSGWRALQVLDRETGNVFPGWWQRFGTFLFTMAASAPLPPPEPLGGVERLRLAQPTHHWLDQSDQGQP